ncbi:RnfABCDGE type electron transport complex subunit E [bacterium]|nr:RnfABCDGE type electron transport complex subunit E [bacterium]NIN91601.1 RnfABCDGE type electron transport complex subunit E [bacterium]NIO17965.1 RnfABCDGE type electron transport complex subunit E [bacterium]NIO73733.1 RnfABCDGE type electron transport complex subunit E [bacterium]
MPKLRSFTNGLLRENPVLVLVLGLCPLLAVSNTAINALGMGIATTFVLTFSNLVISSTRRLIPEDLRIPVFVIVISTFVTVTDYFMAAYFPPLHRALGVFVPLIVVNCIILARAEAFAYRNSLIDSLLDGIGMGLGFILVIVTIGIIREVLGNGTIFGSSKFIFHPGLIMVFPPGAYLTIGFLMGILNIWNSRRRMKR